MFFILAIFDEKHVTIILFEKREKIFVSSSLTSFSDLEVPGTLALVESPIKAKRPSFPIFSNSFVEKELPSVGDLSIFQSAVCNKDPYEV